MIIVRIISSLEFNPSHLVYSQSKNLIYLSHQQEDTPMNTRFFHKANLNSNLSKLTNNTTTIVIGAVRNIITTPYLSEAYGG